MRKMGLMSDLELVQSLISQYKKQVKWRSPIVIAGWGPKRHRYQWKILEIPHLDLLKTSEGDMTFDSAVAYCRNMVLEARADAVLIVLTLNSFAFPEVDKVLNRDAAVALGNLVQKHGDEYDKRHLGRGLLLVYENRFGGGNHLLWNVDKDEPQKLDLEIVSECLKEKGALIFY